MRLASARRVIYTFRRTNETRPTVIKLRSNHSLIFALITAFLTMQWASFHIHLAEHHQHDGDHHQHSIETHSHHIAGHPYDTIDTDQHESEASVVEIDRQCSPCSAKNTTPPYAAVTTHSLLASPHLVTLHIAPPVTLGAKISHLDRSTIYLRAPPYLV